MTVVEGGPDRVRLVEVGPRDGLQNIDRQIDTAVKVKMVNALCRMGLERVEAVSFVHPAAVPQMADAEAVLAEVERRATSIIGLVPNVRGVERALAANIDELNFVLSASESQNRWNLNRSIEGSLALLAEAIGLSIEAGTPMRVTISTAFGCPFEGFVPPSRVRVLALRVADLGAKEICLGDTTGMANPRGVDTLFGQLMEALPDVALAVHLHNTRGSGAANLMAAIHRGVTIFDASLGGLGGCPFAPGATGNICTEDMVHMLHAAGISTGVNVMALVDLARAIEPELGVHLPGQLVRAGPLPDGIDDHFA